MANTGVQGQEWQQEPFWPASVAASLFFPHFFLHPLFFLLFTSQRGQGTNCSNINKAPFWCTYKCTPICISAWFFVRDYVNLWHVTLQFVNLITKCVWYTVYCVLIPSLHYLVYPAYQIPFAKSQFKPNAALLKIWSNRISLTLNRCACTYVLKL